MKKPEECLNVTTAPGVDVPETLRPEINLLPTTTNGITDEQVINCGYVPIVLAKMFGPTIFADLRIRAEGRKCEWVIERRGSKGWAEFCRVPGQLPEDFEE